MKITVSRTSDLTNMEMALSMHYKDRKAQAVITLYNI